MNIRKNECPDVLKGCPRLLGAAKDWSMVATAIAFLLLVWAFVISLSFAIAKNRKIPRKIETFCCFPDDAHKTSNYPVRGCLCWYCGVED